MSQVCTCENPRVKSEGKSHVCLLCGWWWMPERGSNMPRPIGSLDGAQPLNGKRPALIERKPGKITRPIHATAHVGRNDICPCGSGVKHKRCCGIPQRRSAQTTS